MYIYTCIEYSLRIPAALRVTHFHKKTETVTVTFSESLPGA
jgi:hypothetical protein